MNDLDATQHDRALSKLGREYARAADRHDGPAFAALFTPDGIIEGGGPLRLVGYDQLAAMPPALKEMYQATVHTVMNHTATITGDVAEGETYSIAHHINWPKDGLVTRLTGQFATKTTLSDARVSGSTVVVGLRSIGPKRRSSR